MVQVDLPRSASTLSPAVAAFESARQVLAMALAQQLGIQPEAEEGDDDLVVVSFRIDDIEVAKKFVVALVGNSIVNFLVECETEEEYRTLYTIAEIAQKVLPFDTELVPEEVDRSAPPA